MHNFPRGFFGGATYYLLMNENDDQLRRVLRQWRDIEPSPTFAVDVRRRIRLATPAPMSRWGWLAPVATAAAVALMVGAWAGRQATPAFNPPPTTFLAADSLAGGYLRLAERH